MGNLPCILVVDDEVALRETFAEYLCMHGLAAEPLDGGAALRARICTEPAPRIVLLDVTMGGEDGLSLARWLRETQSVGIIMVTGKGDAVDRIVGLEIGADDYVTKPVDLRELVARIRALLRRLEDRGPASPGPAAETGPAASCIPVGDMVLDLSAHRLTDAAGREVALTTMEYDLLRVLAERPDRALSREQLLDLAHRSPHEPFDRSIDIRIARLRRKIERDPARPEIIKTVRGVGYIFTRKRN